MTVCDSFTGTVCCPILHMCFMSSTSTQHEASCNHIFPNFWNCDFIGFGGLSFIMSSNNAHDQFWESENLFLYVSTTDLYDKIDHCDSIFSPSLLHTKATVILHSFSWLHPSLNSISSHNYFTKQVLCKSKCLRGSLICLCPDITDPASFIALVLIAPIVLIPRQIWLLLYC